MRYNIPYLVLSVGHMCNLRCKNCGNFAPYAPPEYRRYPIEEIISDFEALFKVIGHIQRLQIQGGEPLVYSDLLKLIGYLGACLEVGKIEIATNGTINPNDKLMHMLCVNNVEFRISDYPQNRRNLATLLAQLHIYRIPARVYGFTTKESLWFDKGGTDTPREDDDRIAAYRFNTCRNKGCLTLENGELHRCSRAANAQRLQGFNFTLPPQIMSAYEATKICASISWNFCQIRNSRRLVAIVTERIPKEKFLLRNRFKFIKP